MTRLEQYYPGPQGPNIYFGNFYIAENEGIFLVGPTVSSTLISERNTQPADKIEPKFGVAFAVSPPGKIFFTKPTFPREAAKLLALSKTPAKVYFEWVESPLMYIQYHFLP